MLLPNFLKRAMRRSLSRNGELVYDNRMQAERFRELVATPDLIIDVGVANGTPWLYDAFPQTEFILIDPMDECEDQVASRFPNLRFLFHSTALGKQEGTIDLNIPIVGDHTHGSKASTLQRSDHFTPLVTTWDTRSVDVRTLDTLTPKEGRFGLKIDTEGAEASVLQGAHRTLMQCDFVVLELSLRKRFDDVAPPSLSIDLLRNAGLELRDILSLNGGTQEKSPNHMDCLFTRWS